MWIDPNEPIVAGSPARACGLTPFCSPMKPCGLTPYCGKPGGPGGSGGAGGMGMMNAMSPNTLMLGNGSMMNGGYIPNPMITTTATATATPTFPQPTLAPPGAPQQSPSKVPTVAGPNGMRVGAVPNRMMPNSPIPGSAGGSLISMGIVPGVSTITSGGLVVAAGVATPAGVMTPSGVLLPNGMLQSQGVLRACVMHPNCTAARPCGLTAGCGMMVPLNVVSNNAVMLASALSAPGIAGNVMQAGGVSPAYAAAYGTAYGTPGYVNGTVMSAGGIPTDRTGTGMIVNPITGQPVAGLTMNGTTQMGYPPIGYAPTGYSPGYPRPVPGAPEAAVEEEEEEMSPKAADAPLPNQSQMPFPRFHPVPSKPTFQRSEGLPTTPPQKRTVSGTGKVLTRDTLNAAMEQAYLEGIADAMDDVQEEIDAQNQELVKAELQARILRQAQQVQDQFEARQETKLKIQEMKLQEEAAREKDVLQTQYRQTQLQQAQLQQVALQQAQLQQTQLQQAQLQQAQLRQAQYQQAPQGNGKGFFGFLTGDSTPKGMRYGQPTPSPNGGMYVVQQPNPVQRPSQASPIPLAASQQSGAGFGLLDSAKAAGNDLASMVSGTVSPLTSLFSSGQQKMHAPAPQYHYPVPNPQSSGVNPQTVRKNPQIVGMNSQSVEIYAQPVGTNLPSIGLPVFVQSPQQAQPIQTVHVESAPSVRGKSQKKPNYPCPPCPPFDASPSAPVAKVPVFESAIEPTLVQNSLPTRPPTATKKPKKVLDVDDEEEPNMIQTANFIERR